jgi:signal peptidase II
MTILIAALLVVVDQATKLWTVAALELGDPGVTVVPGALYLTYVQNTGAAFGLLRGVDVRLGSLHLDGTFLLGVLSAVVAVWLTAHLLRHAREHGPWTRVALTLVLAGAVGNMIDRFRVGYVIDMVNVRIGWFDFPVFNLADACISVGATLLIVTTLFGGDGRREERPTA